MRRNTQQRAAIDAVFASARRPLTPQEILEKARQSCPATSIATVYRAIRDLAARKRVVSVQVPGRPPMYERADLEHHHHFYCEDCGEVTPLHGCSLDVAYKLPRGFKASSHEVLFSGVCATCRRPAAS